MYMYFSLALALLLCNLAIAKDQHETLLRGSALSTDDVMDGRKLQSGVGIVMKFRLVNATLGNQGEVLVDPLLNGTVVDLNIYPLDQQFSIEAVTSTVSGPVGTVRFSGKLAGKGIGRTESSAPYSLCGDIGSYLPCPLLVAGAHTIDATPFSLTKAMGVQGQKIRVSFSIIAPLKAPTRAPTKTPTSVPTEIPTKLPTKAPTVSLSAAKWIETDANATLNARHEACFLMVGRKAFLLIGRSIKPVNIYDPVTRTWTNGPAPPIQIHHAQCVAANDKIWIVSSWTGGYPMERNNADIHVSINIRIFYT
jgi:hypothetical protein